MKKLLSVLGSLAAASVLMATPVSAMNQETKVEFGSICWDEYDTTKPMTVRVYDVLEGDGELVEPTFKRSPDNPKVHRRVPFGGSFSLSVRIVNNRDKVFYKAETHPLGGEILYVKVATPKYDVYYKFMDVDFRILTADDHFLLADNYKYAGCSQQFEGEIGTYNKEVYARGYFMGSTDAVVAIVGKKGYVPNKALMEQVLGSVKLYNWFQDGYGDKTPTITKVKKVIVPL